MKGKKFFVLSTAWLCAGLALVLFAQAQDPLVLDEIVAKVNNEIITLTDLKRELEGLLRDVSQEVEDPAERQRVFEARKKSLLQSIIKNRLLIQRAEELGVAANIDVDVAAYLEEIRKQAGVPSLEVLDQYLKQNGTSLEQFRQRVKERMIIQAVMQQFVYSKITLLTPEIESYYEENKDRFTEPARVTLSEILLLTEGQDPEQVRQKAEKIKQDLEAGASFEALAREHSDGPTAENGGEIGSFNRQSMNDALEEVAFSLEEGQVSDVIEADYGFQLIKVLERQDARPKPLSEVRNEIVQELSQKKMEPEMDEFMQSLIDMSYIYVAPKYAEEYDVEEVT